MYRSRSSYRSRKSRRPLLPVLLPILVLSGGEDRSGNRCTLLAASYWTNRLEGARAALGGALFGEGRRVLLGAARHFVQVAQDLFAKCRGVIDRKFAVRVADDAMGRRGLGVVFEDEAVGRDLDNVVRIGCRDVLRRELQLNRDQSSIRQTHDVVRFAEQWMRG